MDEGEHERDETQLHQGEVDGVELVQPDGDEAEPDEQPVNTSELIASLEPAPGTIIRFLDVDPGDGVSVFVIETLSEGGTPMLDNVLDLGLDNISALDVYLALSQEDESVPAPLAANYTSKLEAERGWGAQRDLDLTNGPTPQLVDQACNNGTFTASTPNGWLGAAGFAFTRLDNNAGANPSLWLDDCYAPGDGGCYGNFREYYATFPSIQQWRGKACGNTNGSASHTICPNIGDCFVLNPRIMYLVDRDGGFNFDENVQQDSIPVNGGNDSSSWAWFGSGGEFWSWRIHIRYAHPTFDWFDVGMDKP